MNVYRITNVQVGAEKRDRFYDIQFFQNVVPAFSPHTSDSNPLKHDPEIRKIMPQTRNQPKNSLTKTPRIL